MEKINGQEVYNFFNQKSKWLGIIDYNSLVWIAMYVILVFKVVNLFNIYYIYKVYIGATFIVPMLIFVLLNINEECVVEKIKIILFFYFTRKIYIKTEYYAKLNKTYKKM